MFDDKEARLRGRKAQERRLRIWTADPTCAACGKLTEWPNGFELDHIVALVNGGSDTDENLQVLCPTPCHQDKCARDMGHKPKMAIGVDGWPVGG